MAEKKSGRKQRQGAAEPAEQAAAQPNKPAKLPPKEQADERTGEIAEKQSKQPRTTRAQEPAPEPSGQPRTAPRKPAAKSPIRPAAGHEFELEAASKQPEEQSAADEARAASEGSGSPFPVVGIGASAGGLEAMRELLAGLSPDTGMAFIIVPHLAREHESVLVDILGRSTTMPVTAASTGLRLDPDHVYIIPPNVSLAVYHGTLNLMPPEETGGTRTTIDYFMRSLAEDQRSAAIGIVLSGTGSDGALGARAIKAENGIVFAQLPSTAAYDGMPRSAIDTGSVDFILSPEDIATELNEMSKHPFIRGAGERSAMGHLSPSQERDLYDKVFIMLREHTGVDFAFYKPTTIKRRLGRRMVVHKMEGLDRYYAYMEDHPEEIEALYQDLLINVTGFFREPDSFEALKEDVFPRLLEGRGQYEVIRIWVPACSTGEEAYSLAMALTEHLDNSKVKPAIQIFATDISDTSIEKARQGVFPENITSEVSPERIERFFVRTAGGYQVGKVIRESVVFAKHDVTKDPPFSRLDLISCRNLLIYLGGIVQKRLIPVFHYALQPTGFLFLGSSESVGEYNNLFTMVNQKHKIYAKKPVQGRPPIEFGFRQYPVAALTEPRRPRTQPTGQAGIMWAQREAERLSVERFVPPNVLVDEDMQIIQFRGDTTPFLRHAPGKASLNMIEMARNGLATALKTQITKAMRDRTTVRSPGVRVKQDGHEVEIDLEIVPLFSGEENMYFLVFFREPALHPADATVEPGKRRGRSEAEAEQLRRELAHTKEQLRMTIEEKDSSTEELRAANEEIQSSNEELQSINEELETAKEELQSTNEELTTLNEELQNRNFELLSANDDLRNVLTSVSIPIIIVGKDTRIRRYTPTAEKALNLIPTDVGRPIGDLKLKVDVPDLEGILNEVVNNLSVVEREVHDVNGHSYLLQVRPYRTMEDRIEGVVISLLDVEEMRRVSSKYANKDVGKNGK